VILWSSVARTPKDFVISRVSRLYPSFWVGMLLTATVLYVFTAHIPTWRTLLANATMIPAVLDAPRIDEVYWTLEIEIRFYAMVFVLVVLRQMKHIERWLWAWLAATIVCQFVDEPWIVTFATLQPHAPFFVAGGFFYLVLFRGWTWHRTTALVVLAALCALSAHGDRGQFILADEISALVVPAAVVAFFGLFASLRFPVPAGLSCGLGSLTYPLYLTHAQIGRVVYDAIEPTLGVSALLVVTVLALVMSWVIAVTVDIPARKPVARALRRLFEVEILKPELNATK
jgi:peptidoglycan/LPS O-acetylase OafA/YrhL